MSKNLEIIYDINGFQKYKKNKTAFIKSKVPSSIISYINQIPNLYMVLENLKNDDIFRVVVNRDITEKIRNGEYLLRERLDGTGFLPTVVHSNNGKFARQVSLNVENISNNMELISSLSNVMMQGQLNNIMQGIEEINNKINRVLKGQENDRIALNSSAKQQYLEAILVKNDNLRYLLLSNAIKTANDSKYQLIETMKDDIDYICGLSYKSLDQIINSKKYKDIDNRMNSLRKSFITINSSTETCAASYFEMQEYDAMKECIGSYKMFLKDLNSDDSNIFEKLNEWDSNNDDFWIKCPKKIEESIDDFLLNKSVKDIIIDIPVKLLRSEYYVSM